MTTSSAKKVSSNWEVGLAGQLSDAKDGTLTSEEAELYSCCKGQIDFWQITMCLMDVILISFYLYII